MDMDKFDAREFAVDFIAAIEMFGGQKRYEQARRNAVKDIKEIEMEDNEMRKGGYRRCT